MLEDSPLTAHFVEQVLVERQRKGYSINQLADFSGLGRGFVSELLRGRKVPTLRTVEKIADALEVDTCVLLCGRQEKS